MRNIIISLYNKSVQLSVSTSVSQHVKGGELLKLKIRHILNCLQVTDCNEARKILLDILHFQGSRLIIKRNKSKLKLIKVVYVISRACRIMYNYIWHKGNNLTQELRLAFAKEFTFTFAIFDYILRRVYSFQIPRS